MTESAMLTIYRRHLKSCPHTSRAYRRCPCPLWVQGTLGGQSIRKALDVTSLEAASRLVTGWTAAGTIESPKGEPPRLDAAIATYLDAKRNRKLAEATIYKLRTVFEKQLLRWAAHRGYRYLHELTPPRLLDWQGTWKDAPLAASKKYQTVVGFFYFCIRMKWMSENPMKALDAPKAKQTPTLPFEEAEVDAILAACDRFSIKGIYGEGNRPRLRAMVLLLRYSGLRIRDAVTLRRNRIRNGKLLLYTQKTGVPVFVPLPDGCLEALLHVPNTHPDYFFWSGNGLAKSAVADWQRSLSRLFESANVRGHAHMFRDTFAIGLLLAGVTIDQVSILLGHSSVRITEKSYSPWVRARQEQLEAAVRKTWAISQP
jgi:integrase/recombinase XerD